jgi:hypothetical protein
MLTPDSRPTFPPSPDTACLEASRDGSAIRGRPGATPAAAHTGDQPSTAPEQPAAGPPDLADAEDSFEGFFTDDILHALVHALPSGDTDTAEEKYQHKAAAIHLLRSFDAQQPVEAALATQAVLAHHAALAAFRRAAQPAQFSDMTSRETGSAARMSTQFRFLLRELDHRQDRPAQPPKSAHKC